MKEAPCRVAQRLLGQTVEAGDATQWGKLGVQPLLSESDVPLAPPADACEGEHCYLAWCCVRGAASLEDGEENRAAGVAANSKKGNVAV